MSTQVIAMLIAMTLVAGLIIGLAVLSLIVGAFHGLFGKPKIVFLKSQKGEEGFAFAFRWNAAREPAKIDYIKIHLFNPFGSPSQLESTREFPAHSESFVEDLDMGPAYRKLLAVGNFDETTLQIEVGSSKDGINFFFDMKGKKFAQLLTEADQTVDDFIKAKSMDSKSSKPPIDVPVRSFIADTVPGKGAQLAVPTNPAFAAYFQSSGGGGGAAAGGGEAKEAQENFAIQKVWIEPGCIVCNACEDIYPEVFDVQADTCLIRPNPPLDDGLRIEEAAEACPVEVIKFTKVS